jgi:hypothetical protein
MTKAQPLTARVDVPMTEQDFDELLLISHKQDRPYSRIVRDGYQFAQHLHRKLHDDPASYAGMGQDVRQSMKEALDYIFGNPI